MQNVVAHPQHRITYLQDAVVSGEGIQGNYKFQSDNGQIVWSLRLMASVNEKKRKRNNAHPWAITVPGLPRS